MEADRNAQTATADREDVEDGRKGRLERHCGIISGDIEFLDLDFAGYAVKNH